MQVILSIVVIVLGIMMFSIPRYTKLGIFIVSAMCFSLVRLPIPGMENVYRYIAICFILSEIGYYTYHKAQLQRSAMMSLMVLMTIATIVLFINSPHYYSGKGLVNLFFIELVHKYFFIAYAFLSLNKESDLKHVYKISLIGITILTFFALINLMESRSDFVTMMAEGYDMTTAQDEGVEDAGKKYSYSERFRVQSMFYLAFDYGYVCAIFLLFYIYGYLRKIISKNEGLYAIICCSFGIIVCNCRSVLFSALVAVGIFIAYYYKRSYFISGFLLLTIGLTLYSTNPIVSDYIDTNILSIFQKRDKVVGSSIDMRTIQYAAVFSHIEGSELFGKGKDFFAIDMGWKKGRNYLTDDRLEGLEGVFLMLILERGFVGFLFWLIFYFSILIILHKNRSINQSASALGISCIILYLLFSNMTGEMGCVIPTMIVLGIALRIMYLSKKLSVITNNSSLNLNRSLAPTGLG